MIVSQINYEKSIYKIDKQFVFKLADLGFKFYDDPVSNFARFTKI